MNTHSVDELAELALSLLIVNHGLPFVGVSANELVHVALEVRTYAEFVIQQNLAQFLQALLSTKAQSMSSKC